MLPPAKLIAAFVAAVVANAYGQQAGRYLFGMYDTGAGLKGIAALGVGTFVATYLFIRNVRLDRLTSFVFAAFMAMIYGRQVGYSLYFAKFDLQADIYGMGTVFIFALIPGELIVWPVLRTIGNQVATATRKGMEDRPRLNLSRFGFPSFRRAPMPPQQTPAALWATIDGGTSLYYSSWIDRDFSFTDGGWTKKKRLRFGFWLERDTLAMSPRERAAYYILCMLQRHGLDKATADRMTFALTWGDGRCVARWKEFRTDQRLLRDNGLRTGEDVIRHEAVLRGASVEAAITELFTRLRYESRKPGAPDELVKMQKSFTPDGGSGDSPWS